jgi:hypothetical protein
VRLVTGNLVEEHGVLRHNSSRLARLLFDEFLLASRPRSTRFTSM